MGKEVYLSGKEYPEILSPTQPFINIPRGQFALLTTKENIHLKNNLLAFISIRFTIKAQGLINISGFHVDPGYNGTIIFSVFNAGPNDVVLKYGEAVFIIFFYELDSDTEGRKKGVFKNLPVNLVTQSKGTSASLSDVAQRVQALEVKATILMSLLITVAVGLVIVIVRWLTT